MPPIPAAKSAPRGSFFARYQVKQYQVPGKFYLTYVDFCGSSPAAGSLDIIFWIPSNFGVFFCHVRWRENPSPLFLVRFACYFMLPFDQNSVCADLRLPTSSIFSGSLRSINQVKSSPRRHRRSNEHNKKKGFSSSTGDGCPAAQARGQGERRGRLDMYSSRSTTTAVVPPIHPAL